MLKFNNRIFRKRCEICSKLTIKTPERRHWDHSSVFIVNFKHISHLFLELLLLTLNKWMLVGKLRLRDEAFEILLNFHVWGLWIRHLPFVISKTIFTKLIHVETKWKYIKGLFIQSTRINVYLTWLNAKHTRFTGMFCVFMSCSNTTNETDNLL